MCVCVCVQNFILTFRFISLALRFDPRMEGEPSVKTLHSPVSRLHSSNCSLSAGIQLAAHYFDQAELW